MMMMRGNTFCFFEAHFLENTNGGNIWKIQGVFFFNTNRHHICCQALRSDLT